MYDIGTMSQLPNAKDFFYQMNPQGLIEQVDSVTGAIISIQSGRSESIIGGKEKEFVEYQMPDGRMVLAQKGMNMDVYKAGAVEAYKYSQLIADLICNKIMDGGLISKICKEAGMPPYSTIVRWRQQHPEFGEALEMARKARAEAMHDEVLDSVSDERIALMSKDDIIAARLKVDTYKWAAEKNDPNKFGKERVGGSGPGAIQIIVNTGINRDDDGEDFDQIVIAAVGNE